MATFKSVSRLSKRNVFLLILAIVLTCSTAARILDEDASSSPVDTDATSGAGSSISGGVGAGPVGGVGPGEGVTDGPAAGTIAGGAAIAGGPAVGGAAAGTIAGGGAAAGGPAGAAGTIAGASGGGGASAGGASGTIAGSGGGGGASAGGAVVADADAAYGKPELTFFMHDILGGSNPSAKAVTGIVANPAVSGQVPFAKPNGAVLPQNNGGSQDNGNSALINNNNIPFLSGLSGFNPSVVQNNNNNNGNNNLFGGSGFPVVNGGQLPQGITVQKLMFGTLTVFDDELTEGHDLDSGLVGKAEGYYIASAIDGTSHTMAFTALFEEGGYVDSICFFGVHRTAVSQSVLSIMGGTGKYVNAKGVAIVKTFPATPGQTDGLETLLELSVYMTS